MTLGATNVRPGATLVPFHLPAIRVGGALGRALKQLHIVVDRDGVIVVEHKGEDDQI